MLTRNCKINKFIVIIDENFEKIFAQLFDYVPLNICSLEARNIQVPGPTLYSENLDGIYQHFFLHLCNRFLDTKS